MELRGRPGLAFLLCDLPGRIKKTLSLLLALDRRAPDSATTRPCVLAHIDEELSVEYGKRITLKMSNGGA